MSSSSSSSSNNKQVIDNDDLNSISSNSDNDVELPIVSDDEDDCQPKKSAFCDNATYDAYQKKFDKKQYNNRIKEGEHRSKNDQEDYGTFHTRMAEPVYGDNQRAITADEQVEGRKISRTSTRSYVNMNQEPSSSSKNSKNSSKRNSSRPNSQQQKKSSTKIQEEYPSPSSFVGQKTSSYWPAPGASSAEEAADPRKTVSPTPDAIPTSQSEQRKKSSKKISMLPINYDRESFKSVKVLEIYEKSIDNFLVK